MPKLEILYVNNRINEFKLRAGIEDNPDQEGLDLFAQLIIDECANLFRRGHTDEEYQRRIDKTIRKHFGVDVE
jgi:hypothetical protein